MTTHNTHRTIIDSYFACMRRGAEAEADMLALFAVDAVYVEPFTNSSTPAEGVDEIRDRLRAGWAAPLPDLELDVLSIEISSDVATSSWECRSSAFPGPIRGLDRVTFGSEGLITRLDVEIVSQHPE